MNINNADNTKLIACASFILASQCIGITKIKNSTPSEDIKIIIQCLKDFGIKIEHNNDEYIICGAGFLGLQEPKKALDIGTSSIAAILFIGLLAPYDFHSMFTGDFDIKNHEIFSLLKNMLVEYRAHSSGGFPISISGDINALPLDITTSSLLIKFSALFASISIFGSSKIKCKDHSCDFLEKKLLEMGADIKINPNEIKISGHSELNNIEEIYISHM